MDRVAHVDPEIHRHRITRSQRFVLLDSLSIYKQELLNLVRSKDSPFPREEIRLVERMRWQLIRCSLPYELVVSSHDWPTLSRALRTNARGLAMYRMMMRTNTERGPWFPFFYSGVRVPE